MVTKAFNIMDRDGSGVITLEDIKRVYNVNKHPEVRVQCGSGAAVDVRAYDVRVVCAAGACGAHHSRPSVLVLLAVV